MAEPMTIEASCRACGMTDGLGRCQKTACIVSDTRSSTRHVFDSSVATSDAGESTGVPSGPYVFKVHGADASGRQTADGLQTLFVDDAMQAEVAS